jgi:hypothetical protein
VLIAIATEKSSVLMKLVFTQKSVTVTPQPNIRGWN